MCSPSVLSWKIGWTPHASDLSTAALSLDGRTHAARVHAAEKTEMEKLNALELQRVLQLRPGCQVPPV